MPGKEVLYVELRKAPDACLESFSVTSGKIGPSETLVKDDISGEKRLLLKPVKAERPWGMARCVKHLECHIVNPEFSFLQEKGRLEIHDSHCGTVLRSDVPDKIELDRVHGDQGGQARKKANRFHVIGVAVGDHDKIKVVRPQGESRELIRYMTKKMRMTRINKDFLAVVDEIRVGIVRSVVRPEKAMEVIRYFHERLKISGRVDKGAA
jgi:hypothetical protein